MTHTVHCPYITNSIALSVRCTPCIRIVYYSNEWFIFDIDLTINASGELDKFCSALTSVNAYIYILLLIKCNTLSNKLV